MTLKIEILSNPHIITKKSLRDQKRDWRRPKKCKSKDDDCDIKAKKQYNLVQKGPKLLQNFMNAQCY